MGLYDLTPVFVLQGLYALRLPYQCITPQGPTCLWNSALMAPKLAKDSNFCLKEEKQVGILLNATQFEYRIGVKHNIFKFYQLNTFIKFGVGGEAINSFIKIKKI